jgi:hypothetical protein
VNVNSSPADFRDPAVRATELMRAAADPLDLAKDPRPLFSCCERVIAPDLALHRRLRRRAIATIVVALIGAAVVAYLLGAWVHVGVFRRITVPKWHVALGVAVAFFSLYYVGMFPVLEPVWIWNHFRARAAAANWLAGASIIIVRVEDASTYERFKLVVEEHGILYPCGDDCVRIEGVTHRYLIRARDVVQLKHVKRGIADVVFLSYRIGPEVLGLAITGVGPVSSRGSPRSDRTKLGGELQRWLGSSAPEKRGFDPVIPSEPPPE